MKRLKVKRDVIGVTFYIGSSVLPVRATPTRIRAFAKSILKKVKIKRRSKKCAVVGCTSKAVRYALCDHHYHNKI